MPGRSLLTHSNHQIGRPSPLRAAAKPRAAFRTSHRCGPVAFQQHPHSLPLPRVRKLQKGSSSSSLVPTLSFKLIFLQAPPPALASSGSPGSPATVPGLRALCGSHVSACHLVFQGRVARGFHGRQPRAGRHCFLNGPGWFLVQPPLVGLRRRAIAQSAD